MSALLRPWFGLARLLEGRESGEVLAAFRIGTGIALLWNVLGVYFADIHLWIWADVHYGGYRNFPMEHLPWLVRLMGGATDTVVTTLVGVTAVAGMALVGGIWARPMALVGGQALLALTTINAHSKGSYDALLLNNLWILVLANSTATWSLSARIFTGSFRSARTVPWWPRGLVVFQLAVTYFFTALHKVSAAWTPAGGFSALYYIMQQPSWHRFDMSFLAHMFGLTQLATAAVWIFELTFPVVAIWMLVRAVRGRARFDPRLAYGTFGIMMHVGIVLLMEVGPFSAIILAMYPCLMRPSELSRLTARLTARMRTHGQQRPVSA